MQQAKAGVLAACVLALAITGACRQEGENGPETAPDLPENVTAQDPGPEGRPAAAEVAEAGAEEAPAPRIVFQSEEHDFGESEPGEKLEHTFTFRNTGNAELEIRRVRSS